MPHTFLVPISALWYKRFVTFLYHRAIFFFRKFLVRIALIFNDKRKTVKAIHSLLMKNTFPFQNLQLNVAPRWPTHLLLNERQRESALVRIQRLLFDWPRRFRDLGAEVRLFLICPVIKICRNVRKKLTKIGHRFFIWCYTPSRRTRITYGWMAAHSSSHYL